MTFICCPHSDHHQLNISLSDADPSNEIVSKLTQNEYKNIIRTQSWNKSKLQRKKRRDEKKESNRMNSRKENLLIMNILDLLIDKPLWMGKEHGKNVTIIWLSKVTQNAIYEPLALARTLPSLNLSRNGPYDETLDNCVKIFNKMTNDLFSHSLHSFVTASRRDHLLFTSSALHLPIPRPSISAVSKIKKAFFDSSTLCNWEGCVWVTSFFTLALPPFRREGMQAFLPDASACAVHKYYSFYL